MSLFVAFALFVVECVYRRGVTCPSYVRWPLSYARWPGMKGSELDNPPSTATAWPFR